MTTTSFLERQGVELISLSNKDMMVRVYVATKGIPRLIAGLIKTVLESTEQGARITQKDLADGFAKTSMNPDLKNFNPFSASYERVLERAAQAQKKAASDDAKNWDIH